MAEYTLFKLLGGIGNGENVPSDWNGSDIAEYIRPGTDTKSVYERRAYYDAPDTYYVWTDAVLNEEPFNAIMHWHRATFRVVELQAQKDLIREANQSAERYTSVIMVVGYAGLFTIWAQQKTEFTPATSFAAGILLSLSLLAFIAWEIYGMVIRSRSGFAMAKAVEDPELFHQRMREHREKTAEGMNGSQKLWVWNVGIAAGFALASFGVMFSAMLHGAWMGLFQ